MYFLSPCKMVHNLKSTESQHMCYVELGGQNNSEGKLPFPVPCYVIRVRAATSQLQRNSLLRVGTLHVEWIEEC